MKQPIAWQVQSRTGLYAQLAPGKVVWVAHQILGGYWLIDDAREIAQTLPEGAAYPILAPHCPCCGEWHPKALKTVFDHGGGEAIRCEKHAGRLPCIVDGCGRTFKLELVDSYRSQICCGRHWRMAPRRLRDLTALVRRRARGRQGWTPRLLRQHHQFWMRCIRAIEAHGDLGGEGHIDLDEIERLFNV